MFVSRPYIYIIYVCLFVYVYAYVCVYVWMCICADTYSFFICTLTNGSQITSFNVWSSLIMCAHLERSLFFRFLPVWAPWQNWWTLDPWEETAAVEAAVIIRPFRRSRSFLHPCLPRSYERDTHKQTTTTTNYVKNSLYQNPKSPQFLIPSFCTLSSPHAESAKAVTGSGVREDFLARRSFLKRL